MHRLEDVIRAAWRMPQTAKWNPDTAPTCTVTIRPKPTPSGLILPPGMVPPAPKPEDIPTYFVEFTCEVGTVQGAPAYQIVGKCKGTAVVVHQGYMERRK